MEVLNRGEENNSVGFLEHRDVSFPSFAEMPAIMEVQIPTLLFIFSLFLRLLAQIHILF